VTATGQRPRARAVQVVIQWHTVISAGEDARCERHTYCYDA
jgi:hypothetical protein